jgi:hypothetical protein
VSFKSFPKVIGNCFCRLRRWAHAGLANDAIFLAEDLLLNDWSYASRDKDIVMSRAFKDCLLAICAIHQSLSASVSSVSTSWLSATSGVQPGSARTFSTSSASAAAVLARGRPA